MDNSEDLMPGGVAKKIGVSFDETEKQFNEDEKTLEDIIDEELANESSEEPIKEKPKEVADEPVEIPEAPREEAPKPEPVFSLGEDEPEEISEKETHEIREPVVEDRPIKVYGKKKSRKGLIAFLIILIILISLGFLAYYLLSTGTIKSDLFAGNDAKCETPVETVEKKEKSDVNSSDEKVIEVIGGIRAEIEKNHGVNANLITTYNSTFPMHKINEDGTLFALNKSYGLHYNFNGDEWMELAPKLNEEAVKALTESGFSEYAVGEFDVRYYANDSGIICGPVSGGGSPWWISCANENWISEDEELAVELAEAYKGKQGQPIISISVSKDDISESGKNKDYEAVMAGGSGAAQIFYRKKGGEWTYAYGTQNIPSCSLFDDEMKGALSGWTGASSEGKPLTCVNEETNEEVEV